MKDGYVKMPTLQEFLQTGHLGPLILGTSPQDVIGALGDPDDTSRKTNPLLLRYGCVHLVFWKPREAKHELREIAIDFELGAGSLPTSLEFEDWNSNDAPTERRFRDFIQEINYPPMQSVERAKSREMVFASGVTAKFQDEMMVSLRLLEKENKVPTPSILTDEREPTLEQITEMFNEADIAAGAGAKRAALLIAWAGLEATLRRVAFHARRKANIGTQPVVLLRELLAEGRINPNEHLIVERFRQLRMSAAHGLNPVAVPRNIIPQIRVISNNLLASTSSLAGK